jgi:hypothetical protein
MLFKTKELEENNPEEFYTFLLKFSALVQLSLSEVLITPHGWIQVLHWSLL